MIEQPRLSLPESRYHGAPYFSLRGLSIQTLASAILMMEIPIHRKNSEYQRFSASIPPSCRIHFRIGCDTRLLQSAPNRSPILGNRLVFGPIPSQPAGLSLLLR